MHQQFPIEFSPEHPLPNHHLIQRALRELPCLQSQWGALGLQSPRGLHGGATDDPRVWLLLPLWG